MQNNQFAAKMLTTQLPLLLLLICTTISKAQNITGCTSTCGDIHNINFPFRLKSDPKLCGDSRFELNCHNNRTIISLDSRNYNVLEINFDKSLIRAIDPGFVNRSKNCTVLPSYFTTDAPSLPKIYYYPQQIIPIIYVNCLSAVNSLSYVETNFCSKKSSKIRSYIVIGEDKSISDIADNCSLETVGWSSARGLSGENRLTNSLFSIHDALSYGFVLSWNPIYFCTQGEATQGFCDAAGLTCIYENRSPRCYDYLGLGLLFFP